MRDNQLSNIPHRSDKFAERYGDHGSKKRLRIISNGSHLSHLASSSAVTNDRKHQHTLLFVEGQTVNQ